MADNQALTDNELIAVAKSGDSSLLRALTPDEKNRMIALSKQSDAGDVQAESDAMDRNVARYKRLGVPTDELGQPTRPLTMMEKFNDAISNPSPGAILGADLATMATGFLGGKGALPERTASATNGVEAPSVPQMIAKGVLKKVTGLDADEMAMKATNLDRATARMRLAAAKSRTRVATFDRQQAEAAIPPDPATAAGGKAPQPLIMTPDQLQMHAQQMKNAELLAKEQGMKSAAYGRAAWRNPQAAPRPASTLPVETSAAAAPPDAAPAPAAKSAAPPSSSSNPIEALKAAGLSPEEADQAIRWARQGVDLDQVVKRINATRALMRGKPALKDLPTLQEALREVRSR